MLTSDQELLERWISNQDAEAFKDLSSRYAGMVFATCRRILGNDADTEDVAQECFVSLARTSKTPGAYLGPWLHHVATNLSLNWIRTESRKRNRESSQKAAQQNAATSPDSEILALVDEAIAKLPESQRAPVIAYFFEDQTQESIAKNLGLTRQGAANRISTGVESIRKTLSRQGIRTGAVSFAALLTKEASATPPSSLSTALGKLAITGAIAAEKGATSSIPVFGFLASNIKVAASALALLTIILAFTFWRSTPPQSSGPTPNPIPIASQQPAESESESTQNANALAPTPVVASPEISMGIGTGSIETPELPPKDDDKSTEESTHSEGTVFLSG
ncbi:MAG: sigma-70 family RNA polymerase sigma factor [Candidatus Hydrogenedentota bacterium]